VRVTIDPQSQDIAQGVIKEDGAIGASDQGIVYGYATNETPEGLPLPLVLAQRLTRALTTARITQTIPWLRPDGKAQVSVRYVGDTPQEVTAFVVSAQHRAEVHIDEVRSTLEALACEALGSWVTPDTHVHINPTGRFVVGGPLADSGLTGRKVIADTYGGVAHHGGGAFSGKDGTKVDRSAAYAARQAALHLVRSKLAARAEIAIAYAIGVDKPVAVSVDTFGTGTMFDEALAALVTQRFDLRPAAIIARLNLRAPIFERTARDGHVGHADLPWEQEQVQEVVEPAKYLWKLTRRDVDHVLHYTHIIPLGRGYTRDMLAEYYPGWNMNAMTMLFDKAGIRIKPTDLNGSHGAMNGGRCHWQVAAFYFSSPEEFHVVWDRTLPYDEDFTVSYQYEMDCKQRGAPLEKYKGPAGEWRESQSTRAKTES
jgi:S-adenosylmethionine synthetase